MESDLPTSQANYPISGQTIFAALRDVLATLYPIEEDARVIVADAELDEIKITFSKRSQTNWHNILAEAVRQDRLDTLLKIALSDYATNPTLLAAYGQYRLFIEQGGSLEAPGQLPAGTSVTITGNANISQGDFVGRDKNIRSIVTGRDVIGSLLITGDHNQVFVGDYERLRDAYVNPGSVFDRIDLEHFTGREWLLAEVDRFLETHDRGYFILEAAAGLGKTTFMAWLVKQRNYIHHFSELAPGQEGIGIALRNLAAQLALAYELQPEGALPSAARRPDYLHDLLKQAALNLSLANKIVLVIDALDEAGTPLNQNVLGLPAVLPKGVYIIVSQRPVSVTLRVETSQTPNYHFSLISDDPNNQEDMRRFLNRAATWPGIVQALQDNHHTVEQFTTTLLDKCRGVWIYLHYVVYEIERGERSPLALSALPNGMTQYYIHYWQRWRDKDEIQWDECYLPLLTTLAAAQEALSCQRLLAWSGVKITERVLRRLLEERWRPFLAIDKYGQEHRYRFYHATLQELFDGRLAENRFSSAEMAIAAELVKETQLCHLRLAERYLQAWGGLEAKLPGLQEATKRDLDEQYGLRHIAAHLESSKRFNELHYLLLIEWERAQVITHSAKGHQAQRKNQIKKYRVYYNVWHTVREGVGQIDGYLADVTRAWRLAEKYSSSVIDQDVMDLNGELEEGWQNKWLGLQCRYALIVASLNSLAHNILPELLTELVKMKIWLPQQGLVYVRQTPDSDQRAEALIQLAPYLPIAQVQEALTIAQSIEDSSFRIPAFISLASRLAELGRVQEALTTAASIKDSYLQVKALSGLIPYLRVDQQDQVLQKALATATSIKDSYLQVKVLTDLISHLPIVQQKHVLQEALTKAQHIDFSYSQADALIQLALRLAELGQVQEALTLATNIKSGTFRAKALSNLVFCLTELGQAREALTVAASIEDSSLQIKALIRLAPHLPIAQQEKVLQVAQTNVRNAKSHFARTEAQVQLVCLLAQFEQVQEALTIANSIEDSTFRAKALISLAPHLPIDLQEQMLQEALTNVRDIEDGSSQADTQAHLISSLLAFDQPQEVLKMVRNIENVALRTKALIQIILRMSELGHSQEALTIATSIEDSSSRADALTRLVLRLAELDQAQEALTIAASIEDRALRVHTLAQLALRLAELDQAQEALTIAASIEDRSLRVSTLAQLALRLAELDQAQEALAIAASIEDRSLRVSTLAQLALRLAELGQVQEALAITTSEDGSLPADTLAQLALRLAELGQVQEALTVAASIKDSSFRESTLAKLALPLAELGQVQEALTITTSIKDNYYRAKALTNLAPHLPTAQQEKVLQEALSTIQLIKYEYFRTDALAKLALRLAELGQAQEALTVATSIKERYSRVKILIDLAPHLPTAQQKKVLKEALTTIQHIKYKHLRADALTRLALQLAELGQVQEALTVAASIKDNYFRAKALISLSSRLAELGQAQEALTVAASIEDHYFGTDVLVRLALRLAELGQAQEALTVATSIGDSSSRVKILIDLAPYLPIAQQEKVLQEALVIAQNIEDNLSKSNAMANLALGLAELGYLHEAFTIATSIENRSSRTNTLTHLASQSVKLTSVDLYSIWCKMLPFIASRTREHLLADFTGLALLIAHLGKRPAIVETIQAIQDVGRWWP